MGVFWTAGFLIIIPNSIAWEVNNGICLRTKLFGDDFTRIYLLCATLISTMIPLTVMIVCYCIIIQRMFKRMDKNTNKAILQRRTKVVKLLGILIILYFLGGLGIFIYNFLRFQGYFKEVLEDEQRKRDLFNLAVIPLMLEGTLNVIVYSLMKKEIRECYRNFFKSCLVQ